MKYTFLFLAFIFIFDLIQGQSPINTSALPAYTNEERDNIQNLRDGMIIYNSTTHCINYYGNGLWRALCGQCASPPPAPTVLEIKPFYNSVTIRLKPDLYQHQFALMPSFTLLPDTSSKKVIIRDENTPFEQVMLLNVSDCGSSQPMLLEAVKFLEKNPCGNDPVLTDVRDGNEYRTFSIGDQCWMTTNLRYGKEDNKRIFLETDNVRKLYDWNFGEVKKNPKTGKFETKPSSENVCPAGWHIPTESDLDEMIQFYRDYGSPVLMRFVFKSDDNAHIYDKEKKTYEPLDEKLLFWSASNAEYDDSKCVLLIRENEILKHYIPAVVALPIRCIKDKE